MGTNIRKTKGIRTLSMSVTTILLVAASVIQLSSMTLSNGNVVYAYSSNFNSAASLVINCSGDHQSSQNCVNNNLESQGKNNDNNAQVSTPPGPPGPQGPAGPAGSQGEQGLQGIQGIQGVKGDTGATGPAGAVGPAGSQGEQGLQGVKGDTGATGPAGSQGEQGLQGIQGIQGVKGDTGATGPAGAVGPAGPAGAVGPAGPAGAVGPAGPAGPQGESATQQVLQARVTATNFKTIPSGTGDQVFAPSCASDEVVTGGGTFTTGSQNNENKLEDTSTFGPGSFRIINPGPNAVNIGAYAICAKLVDAP
jgi:collagen triple helix repeat protein